MQRLLLSPTNQAEIISQAAEVLSAGGLVVYPTETVYGVGVDATSEEAVSKLLAYKDRPAGKAISVLVADQEGAEELVELNGQAKALYSSFLPGPVTVVSKSRNQVDPRLESEFGTLGIRISSHPLAQLLAKEFSRPISATSANSSGKARPYSIDQLLAGLSEHQQSLIDLIIDAGELPHTEPSTVIDTTQQTQEIIRAGSLFTSIRPDVISKSEEETKELGKKLMTSLLHNLKEGPVVLALEGDLGTGKTQFAKGVAAALGIDQTLTSPTYTLMKEYETVQEGQRTRLIHVDCWRLEKVTADELGLSEYLQPYTVLVVEWVSPLLSYFHEKRTGLSGYHLFFEPLSEQERRIKIGEL